MNLNKWGFNLEQILCQQKPSHFLKKVEEMASSHREMCMVWKPSSLCLRSQANMILCNQRLMIMTTGIQ